MRSTFLYENKTGKDHLEDWNIKYNVKMDLKVEVCGVQDRDH